MILVKVAAKKFPVINQKRWLQEKKQAQFFEKLTFLTL